MTARPLSPGAMVLDAAGFVGLSDMSGFSAAGVHGVSLYVGGRYGVTRATVQAAWDANLVVQLNYERAAAAYLDGYNGGRAAADNALSQSYALGWDNDSPIVFSATDTTVTNTDLADGWYRGMVDRMLANGATGGAYGPAAYLRHLAVQPWWPDDFVLWHWAGDGAKPESWTWAQQLYPGVTIAGVSVDKNRILKEYPFWSGLGHIDPQENDMLDATDKEWLTRELVPAIVNSAVPGIVNAVTGNVVNAVVAAIKGLPQGVSGTVDYDRIEGAAELAVKTVFEQVTWDVIPQFPSSTS